MVSRRTFFRVALIVGPPAIDEFYFGGKGRSAILGWLEEEGGELGEGAARRINEAKTKVEENVDRYIDRLRKEGEEKVNRLLQPIFAPVNLAIAFIQFQHQIVDFAKMVAFAVQGTGVDIALPLVNGARRVAYLFMDNGSDRINLAHRYLECYQNYFNQRGLGAELHARRDADEFYTAWENFRKAYQSNNETNTASSGVNSVRRSLTLGMFALTAVAAARNNDYGPLTNEHIEFYRGQGAAQHAQKLLKNLNVQQLNQLLNINSLGREVGTTQFLDKMLGIADDSKLNVLIDFLNDRNIRLAFKVPAAGVFTPQVAAVAVDPCLDQFVSMLRAVQGRRSELSRFKDGLSPNQLQKLDKLDNVNMARALIDDANVVVKSLSEIAKQKPRGRPIPRPDSQRT